MGVSEPEERSAQLREQGWTRRFTAIGNRLSEAVALYEELGYEVRMEPVDVREEETAGTSACESCFVMSYARTIYTRPPAVNHV